jgi:glycosyltransferase involved in cell wall biosynthesis
MGREPLTLAFLVNLYPPYVVGGNEILAQDVIGALRARGHVVHVLTGRGRLLPDDGFTHGVMALDLDRKQDVFLGGVPFTLRRAIRWHLYDPASRAAVAEQLGQIGPDLVVAWNLYGASMAPLVAACRSPFPVVAQPADKWLLNGVSDLSGIFRPRTLTERVAVGAIRTVVQPILRRLARPKALLTVSEFIRRLHLAAGFAADRVTATYLGIPLALFPSREREPPRDRPWRLMFAGQLWEGKGPQVAVDAMALLQGNGASPVELTIFGGGTDDFVGYLRRRIDERGVAERVRLGGFVPREQLAREFLAHDAFLFCSTWDEPFSGGLLEALCAGLPTVATTAGGTPEAITDGVNGLLVPPGSPEALAVAITRVMREPELAARLSRTAAEDVRRRWSFDSYIDRLEAAYQAAAQRARTH